MKTLDFLTFCCGYVLGCYVTSNMKKDMPDERMIIVMLMVLVCTGFANYVIKEIFEAFRKR